MGVMIEMQQERNMQQEKEWAEAQKIAVSIDLVEATKVHLKFLAVVDRNRFLYEDDVLRRAIYRYNAFWLPLLAKHLENPVCEGPLVVPLDCEWIWHCHRLNPVRYMFDCRKLYGRILGNQNVVSSVGGTSKSATEETWNKMYPEEPYELDLSRPFSEEVVQKCSVTGKFTTYDLLSAVKRQVAFTFQITRPYISDDLFLRESAARYKAFLHLVRTNKKMKLDRYSVPTYDIDLMWHTHQLSSLSYCKDTAELVGFVIQHDDTDSDRTEGGKLANGHAETTKQWEETYGTSFWKAGTMYRGTVAPITQVPYKSNFEGKQFEAFEKFSHHIQFNTLKGVEVLLEFADIKNLPEEYKENLVVVFSKVQHDQLFTSKASLGISSHSKEKQVAIFQCEPKGEFLVELMEVNPKTTPKLLGSFTLSLQKLFDSQSELSINKWVSVDLGNLEPVLVHVFMSFTPPTPAPQVFQLVWSEASDNDNIQTVVMDAYGNQMFSLEKRNTESAPNLLKEVYIIANSGEKQSVVELNGDKWSVKGTGGSLKLQNSSGNDDSLFELLGYDKMVKIYPGKRLDFQLSHFKNRKADQDLMTAVEFSAEHPYGRAVALIDANSGVIKAIDEFIVLPSIALVFMSSNFDAERVKHETGNANGDIMRSGTHELEGAKCAVCVIPCGPGSGDHLVKRSYLSQFMSRPSDKGDDGVLVVKADHGTGEDIAAGCFCYNGSVPVDMVTAKGCFVSCYVDSGSREPRAVVADRVTVGC